MLSLSADGQVWLEGERLAWPTLPPPPMTAEHEHASPRWWKVRERLRELCAALQANRMARTVDVVVEEGVTVELLVDFLGEGVRGNGFELVSLVSEATPNPVHFHGFDYAAWSRVPGPTLWVTRGPDAGLEWLLTSPVVGGLPRPADRRYQPEVVSRYLADLRAWWGLDRIFGFVLPRAYLWSEVAPPLAALDRDGVAFYGNFMLEDVEPERAQLRVNDAGRAAWLYREAIGETIESLKNPPRDFPHALSRLVIHCWQGKQEWFHYWSAAIWGKHPGPDLLQRLATPLDDPLTEAVDLLWWIEGLPTAPAEVDSPADALGARLLALAARDPGVLSPAECRDFETWRFLAFARYFAREGEPPGADLHEAWRAVRESARDAAGEDLATLSLRLLARRLGPDVQGARVASEAPDAAEVALLRAAIGERMQWPAPPAAAEHDWLGWYLGLEALYETGGPEWHRCRRELPFVLRDLQRTDGSFLGPWPATGAGAATWGEVYSTTLAVLCLDRAGR